MTLQKNKIRLLAIALFLSLSFTVQAMDKNGNYAVWSMGKKSCYSYTKAKGSDKQVLYDTFIMGYLTAYNAISAETYSISGSMTLSDILQWLDDYCELKPVHSFELALSEFLVAHKENRLKQSPVGLSH